MARLVAEKDGAIGWLVFDNQAKLNALTFEMWTGLPPALAAFARDAEVRVIVLRGAGDKAFVSGADISQFETKRGDAAGVAAYAAAVENASTALAQAEKPTIAMIRGYCIGGGLAVALNCDIRIAAEGARFAIPAAKLGLGYPYGGVKQLVDIVGPAFAKEIFFTARQFGAAEAEAMHLVNRLVAGDALEATVRDLAARIGANAPLTIRAAKLAIEAALGDAPDKDIAAAEAAIAACSESADYTEGRRAFVEKRKPMFRGR